VNVVALIPKELAVRRYLTSKRKDRQMRGQNDAFPLSATDKSIDHHSPWQQLQQLGPASCDDSLGLYLIDEF